jgi:hypothetical protein
MNAIVTEHVPVGDLPPAWGAKLAKATNSLPASRISAARGFSFEAFNPLVAWGTGVGMENERLDPGSPGCALIRLATAAASKRNPKESMP